MQSEAALFWKVPWEILVGALLYAVPLGVFRAWRPRSASPSVRAADGLGLLAMGCVTPWAVRYLAAPQVVATLGGTLAGLFGLRQYLAHGPQCPPRAGQKPLLLLFRGRFLPHALRAAHLSEAAVRQRLARQGIHRVSGLFVSRVAS